VSALSGSTAPVDAKTTAVTRKPSGPAKATLEEVGDIAQFGGRTLRALPGAFRYFSESLRHASEYLTGSTPLLFVMCGFFGFSVVNFTFFFLRGIGAEDATGLVVGYGLPRICVPAMFDYVFVSKICCGMVASIGAMKANEEIDAYEAQGVDPLRYVVATRLLGALMYLPIAFALAMAGGLVGAYVDAVVILGVSQHVFFTLWQVATLRDLLYMIVAEASVLIPATIVSGFYGLRTSGGPAAVGDSVARSLMMNLLLMQIANGFVLMLFYGHNVSLPIGG
jgi:phospholipid/cholesterol/gamma-HCH transport system permease protein